MLGKLNPEVLIRYDSRGRGYGSSGPVTDASVELLWNDGGYCIKQNQIWYYRDKANGSLVLAQEKEQILWTEIAQRKK